MSDQIAEQAKMMGAAVPPEVAGGDFEPLIDGFVEDDPTTWGNPGRNEACPCGSGKKFKQCHGRLV